LTRPASARVPLALARWAADGSRGRGALLVGEAAYGPGHPSRWELIELLYQRSY
jgi:hypothetical protein